MKSAIGTEILSTQLLVDHELDAGNGLTYFCDAAGHQYSCVPGAPFVLQWSDTVGPNGAYQMWLKAADGKTASIDIGANRIIISYSVGA